MFLPFFNNIVIIISFLFLIEKLCIHLSKRKYGFNIIQIIITISLGLLCIVIMQYQFTYKGMKFDLTEVPVFVFAFIAGWKYCLILLIFPTLFIFYTGREYAILTIVFGLLLPWLIGGFFNKINNHSSIFMKIDLKGIIKGYLVFAVTQKFLGLVFIPILEANFNLWFFVSFHMVIFGILTVIIITFIINDANNNISVKKMLEHQSNHDYLTNLPNLRYFMDRVNNLILNEVPLSIAMIDIDFFKSYNDVHGHLAGDVVLKKLSEILTIHTRGSQDIVARYGGEEFIVCFTNVSDINMAYTLAERIRESVEKYEFKNEKTQPNKTLTVSIGVSILTKQKSLNKTIEEADKALYKSKQTGRNKVSVFKPSLTQEKVLMAMER